MSMNCGARKPDDIMAEYLLGGAKMLAELCPKCGAPMFEVKGKRMCVVCAEAEKSSVQTAAAASEPKVADTLRVITPKYAAAPAKSVPVSEDIPSRLDALILQFCARAEGEPDPSRCLSYMECIRTAAEARVMLNR
ncbi:hypothetical protein McpSp1_14390 [Methanocorpusculaceae archaeon Sp1]|nr:hypothetical protein [Methanocorpusculaceae archaeon Sp1]